MPKPTPGRKYTIVKGDNLTHIARAAYGNGREWRRIWKANSSVLRSGDPNLIFPGEVINIPGPAPEIKALDPTIQQLPGKALDDFTIVVEGRELPVQTGQLVRAADNAVYGWTATIYNYDQDPDLKELLRPYSYREAQCYLGGQLAVDGRLYGVKLSIGIDGAVALLSGWSYAADMVDSSVKPPYEASKVTLEDRAKALVDPLGITVVVDLDDDARFDRVTADKTETIFDHLVSLAKQRGALVTSNAEGNLVLTQAATTEPVGTLQEGLPPFQNAEIDFEGRDRFNVYKALGQSPKKNSKTATAKDSRVPTTRSLTFSADDSTGGDIQKAANWRRSKQISDALSFSIPVPSWYAPNGELWAPNTIVTVKSPTLYLDDGYNFLIREVTYDFSASGTTANLSLVPPEAYTGEEIVEPW